MPGCKGECFVYVWNALALLMFACIHWAAHRLCRTPAARRNRILKTLCALLLGGNLFRYCVFHPLIQGTVRIPVEFSTVAYFAAPALLLRRKPRLRSWAAYSGLMAGFFYYMAMILAGGSLYAADAPLEVLISLLCHGTLYFCGFVVVRTESFRLEEASRLGLGVATVALRAVALRPVAECGHGGAGVWFHSGLFPAEPTAASAPCRPAPGGIRINGRSFACPMKPGSCARSAAVKPG